MFYWLADIDDIVSQARIAGISLFMDGISLSISHPDHSEAIRMLNGSMLLFHLYMISQFLTRFALMRPHFSTL